MAYKFSVHSLLRIKCPFYFMTHSWRRNFKALKKVCRFPLFDLSPTFGIILGLAGMAFNLYDIKKVLQCEQLLSCNCFRLKTGTSKVKSTHERDFKLINLVLSLEYYMLIVFGTGLKRPVLFIPWLTLYAFIILGDIAVFLIHLFQEGCNFDKHFLCSGILMVYNWLAVFCLFLHIKSGR